ncbi:barstar family protein [Rhodococcus sp. NPDC059234]|uniref:barstar family protein n=1 Tax=Rhodococcus sp. NPDC059234 TaxID=3346781 RepID=UPI00366E9EC1
MSFPAYYGRNPSAFNDVLGDVAQFAYGSDPDGTGTVLAIAGFDTLLDLDGWNANLLLDIFARNARLAALCGHPMLCLVECVATGLEPVGARDVLIGPMWDVEPDPPAPFHDGDIVENEVQIYATEAGAAGRGRPQSARRPDRACTERCGHALRRPDHRSPRSRDR